MKFSSTTFHEQEDLQVFMRCPASSIQDVGSILTCKVVQRMGPFVNAWHSGNGMQGLIIQ